VKVPQATAFEVFTQEIDLWWRKGPKFRFGRQPGSLTFEPSESGTLVTVQHRGWAAIRADHPARHGLQGADFSRMIGLWWGDLMSAMRVYVEHRRGK
jgi:hypothetical protein